MLQLILRVLLAFAAFRLIGDLLGRSRRKERSKRPGPRAGTQGAREEVDPYRDLTPYEIEDVDYEDLPARED